MLAQQEAQMLPFVLLVENLSEEKGRACAQCIREAAGGAWRVYGASSVKKIHDTLVVCRMQKCACAVQCVVRVSCGEQFTRHMFGADADRAVGSQSRVRWSECASRGGAHCRMAGGDGAHAICVGGRVFTRIHVHVSVLALTLVYVRVSRAHACGSVPTTANQGATTPRLRAGRTGTAGRHEPASWARLGRS